MDKNIEYLLHKLEMECSDIDTIREDIKDTYEEFDSKLIELKESILSDTDDLIKEYKKVLEEKAEKLDTEKEDIVDQYKDTIEKRRERFHTLCEKVLVDEDQEHLYNFDPDKLHPGDTVFGIVMNLKHANWPQYRFPFRIIEDDYSHNIIKLIGLHAAEIDTFKYFDAVRLKYDIVFIINHELVYLENCSIMDDFSVRNIDITTLDYSNNIKKNPILAIGIPYWMLTYPVGSEHCYIVKPDGQPSVQSTDSSSYIVPFAQIVNKLHHRKVNDMPTI